MTRIHRVRATFSYLLGAPTSSRQTFEGARIADGNMMAATVCRLEAGAPSRYDARLGA